MAHAGCTSCTVDVSTQALLQVLTSAAAGCRGFTVAPAGSTLLAAAPAAPVAPALPFSFGLPPVPLQKPVSALLGYPEQTHHGALSWSDDSMYASHIMLKRMPS